MAQTLATNQKAPVVPGLPDDPLAMQPVPPPKVTGGGTPGVATDMTPAAATPSHLVGLLQGIAGTQPPTPNINVTSAGTVPQGTNAGSQTPGQTGAAPLQVATETAAQVPGTHAAAAPPGTSVPLPTADIQTFGATPGSNLIDTQINPTGTDRLAIAKQYFDEMQAAGAPAYEASLRSATQREAANGGLGSGQLNTTFGNLALQRAQNLDSLQKQLQTAATEGTIADKQAAQQALRDERSYQNALQVQALQQQLAEITLQNNIANQKASYLGSYNPNSNIAGAQAYQSQADALMKSLQDMLKASAVNTNTLPPPPPAPIQIPNDFPQAYNTP